MTNLWNEAIKAWTLALRAGGRPATTIRTRTQHLRQLSKERPDLHPWELTVGDLLDWLGSHDWSREARHAARSSLRAFYEWAWLVGHVGESPAARLPAVPRQPPAPRPVTDAEYRAALMRADERQGLALRLAAEAGLRRGEVARVHTSDLVQDLFGWSLVVHGKGDRVRLVPIPDSLADAIRDHARGGYAFPGDDDGHLSPLWMGKIVSQVLPAGRTMHSLRHRFATRAYAVDRDLLTVQRLLGHASPETTRRYVQLPDDALRRTVLAAA